MISNCKLRKGLVVSQTLMKKQTTLLINDQAANFPLKTNSKKAIKVTTKLTERAINLKFQTSETAY